MNWVKVAIGAVTFAAFANCVQAAAVLNEAYCIERPTLADERSARHSAGVKDGVRGEVSLHCSVTGQDSLRECRVLSETPPGNHFADAALLLSRDYQCKVIKTHGGPTDIEFSYVFDRRLPDSRDWRTFPDEHTLRVAIPPQAVAARVNGAAVLECGVTVEGRPSACRLVAEAPEGLGFGSAALVLTPGFRWTRPVSGGVPIDDGTVRFLVQYPSAPRDYYDRTELEPVAPVVYWAETPSRADVVAAFRGAATGHTTTDRVVFRCRFLANGALTKCDVLDAVTDNSDLIQAARSLLPKFKMATQTVDPALLPKLQANVTIRIGVADDDGSPRTLEKYEWIRALSQDKLQQVFPSKAADAGLSTGRVVLDCAADVHGLMAQCQVQEETPTGMDFGPAALTAAAVMGINPWTNGGEPVEGAHVRFAIRLNRNEPEAAAPRADAATKPQ